MPPRRSSQMAALSRIMKTLCLALLCSLPLTAQTVTLDASRLTAITPFAAAWRFHPGDNPAYASPNFDDASWPTIPPQKLFSSQHLPNIQGGYLWQRLQLHIQNPTQPIALRLTITADLPFQVFANGQLLYTSPSMPARVRQAIAPVAIPLPPFPEILLAVRVFAPSYVTFHILPVYTAEIGPTQALTDSSNLAALTHFNQHSLAEYLDALVLFAVVLIAFTLFFFQRTRIEYLALAVFALNLALFYLVNTLIVAGELPISIPLQIFVRSLAWFCLITGLEFVARFALVQRFLPIRIFQICILAFPWFPFLGDTFYNLTIIPAIAAFFMLAGHYLGAAWRRGRAELGLLMPPILFWTGILLYGFTAELLPGIRRLPTDVQLGPVGISLDHIGSLILVSGIAAVVLSRFIRVSQDEQRAAAELEAARTVQQILIPEALPAIPGLNIDSAYRPAQQVGGDFFQIVPLPQNACLIVLGDVAGKGMPAAMTVSVLVGAIRALAEYTQSPAELLAGLNRRLFGRQTSFTTCVILHIAAPGPSGSSITAANAGHLAPYRNGREIPLESGLPLGFTPDAAYPESRFILAPGESLTLLTDGVVEAAHPHTRELFGFARAQAISTQPAPEIAAAAQAFGHPAPQADDITVLSIALA